MRLGWDASSNYLYLFSFTFLTDFGAIMANDHIDKKKKKVVIEDLADDGVVLQPKYHCEESDRNYKYEEVYIYIYIF